jgi:YHS domain-containing protein
MRISKSVIAVVTAVMTAVMLSAPAVSAQTEKPAQLKPQTECPVMGGKINKNVYADFEGKRIYFCCKGCIPEFNKDPSKYMKKLEETGQAAETVSALKPQTTCPVTGDPIDKKLYVDYKGKRIYVCCGDCAAKLKKNPEKYLKKLNKTGQEAETIKNERGKPGQDSLQVK